MEHKVAYVGAPLEIELDGVVQIPVLRIVYKDISSIGKINEPLVLTSKRGVIALKMSNISLGDKDIYCIGKQTADYLERIYSRKALVPVQQNTNGLAELLIRSERSVHIVSSDQVSEKFMKRLKNAGINVKITTAYEIKENDEVDFQPLKKVQKILVGSSRSFRILQERAMELLEHKELYAIGNPTKETMKELGYEPVKTFDEPDIAGIIRVLSAKR
ncbi:MAG: uroporphyrinogen-III synthase [Thermoplasmata archaeon]